MHNCRPCKRFFWFEHSKMPAKSVQDPNLLPIVGGAYALVICRERPSPVLNRPPLVAALPPGTYVYTGSARGPGGIRARVRRHFHQDKAIRWHVDYLTVGADRLLAWPLPGGKECSIVETLCQLPGITIPSPGFGSSDCRTCPAHLLAVDGLETVAAAITGLAASLD